VTTEGESVVFYALTSEEAEADARARARRFDITAERR
jgi:hypothetical protein